MINQITYHLTLLKVDYGTCFFFRIVDQQNILSDTNSKNPPKNVNALLKQRSIVPLLISQKDELFSCFILSF